MRLSLKSKAAVVAFVEEELARFEYGSAVTMTIKQVTSEDFSVNTVTDASSEDIERLLGKFYLERLYDT